MSGSATVKGVLPTTAIDRCDGCGLRAVARVLMAAGELDLCRRCLLRHADALRDKVEDVAIDEVAAAELHVTDAYVCTLLAVVR